MKTIHYLLSLALIIMLASCSKDNDMTPENNEDDPETTLEFGLGADINETSENVPSTIYFGNSTLPSQYDIEQYLPPVGNQGSYGTCVSWALGYNLKTMIEAQDQNWSSGDLSDARNQFSPKDLFLAIPNSQKGTECNGTTLSAAFDIMQNRGIATMNTAPYTGLGDCSQGTQSSWDNEASGFKIENYRAVSHDIVSIKRELAQDKPVGFGARLGDNFMTWNSNQVLNGHTTFDQVGQHAGHAMTVVGYDDNKGPNGAFRVINSWGENWGDRGFIWIDYNFFVSQDFLIVAYVASNQKGDVDPDNPVDPTSNGDVDLIPWGLWDTADYYDPTSRSLSYNVYNIGSETARASQDWAITYLYYNAYDANEYGFLLYDYYSNDFGSQGQNGEMSSGPATSGNWWNHVDVPGGSSVSQAVTGSDENFDWGYEVPNITGYYYLVMIADVFDVLNDKDKNNNYFYMTDSYGGPIWFENGVANYGENEDEASKSAQSITLSERHMAPADLSMDHTNAYTKDEITEMLKAHKASGNFKEKLSRFKKK